MAVDDYAPTIDAASREWNVDPNLLRAIMHQESGGKPGLISKAGARGLMQVMPGTGAEMGATNIDDPEQNIYAGAKYLSQMLDKYKNPDHALIAYNAGPARADAFVNGKGTLPAETLAYVPSVKAHYTRFKGRGEGVPRRDAEFLSQTASDKVPSDADFLKMTAPSASSDVPSDADFLKMTGGKPAEPVAPVAPSAPVPTGDMPGDVASAPPATIDPQTQTTQRGLARNIAAGAVEGGAGVINAISDLFGNLVGKPLIAAGIAVHHALAPHMGWQDLTPQQRADLLGDDVPQPGTRMVNALSAATSAPRMEDIPAHTTAERLARSATSGGMMMAPFAGNALANFGVGALGGMAGQVASDAVSEPYQPIASMAGNALAMGGVGVANKLAGRRSGVDAAIARRVDEIAARGNGGDAASGATPSPGPPPGPGIPESVGAAATPGDISGISMKEAKAYAKSAHGQKLIEPQQPGLPDAKEYVPGTVVTPAEVSQDVGAARQEAAMERNPEGRQIKEAIRGQNDAAIKSKFDEVAGNPVTTMRAENELNAQFDQSEKAIFTKAQPVDAQPVADTIQSILSSREGRRDAVKNTLNSVLDSMREGEGLITDADQLYGVRKHINDMLDAQSTRNNPQAVQASRQLLEVKAAIDSAIEPAAPGFNQLMADYAAQRGPIEAQKFLQDQQKTLVDAKGMVTHAKFQNFMRRVVDSIDGKVKTGAESLTPEQLASLWDIRDHLRRQETAFTMGRGRGESNTTIGIGDLMRGAGELAAHAAVAGATQGNPLANLALQWGKNKLGAAMEGRKQNRLMDETYKPSPLIRQQD